MMSTYQVASRSSGQVLWTGEAEDEDAALDASARDAGFASRDAEIQETEDEDEDRDDVVAILIAE